MIDRTANNAGGIWQLPILRQYRDSFAGLPRAAWLLGLVAFVNSSGKLVLAFFALYARKELGFSVSEAGLLLSLYGVGEIVGTYLGGRLSSRAGATTTQIVSLLLGGVGMGALLFLASWTALAVGLLAVSTVTAAFRPASATAIADCVEPALRPRAMALKRLAYNLGAAIGPAVGGFLAALDYSLLFYADAVISIAAGVLLLAIRNAVAGPGAGDEPGESDASADSAVWRDRVFLLGVVFLLPLLIVFYQIGTAYPLYLEDAYGLVESEIGFVFAINSFVIVLVEMLLVKRLDERNHLRVIAVGALVSCLGFGLLPLGESLAFAAALMVVVTVGEMLAFPFSMAFAATRTESRARGRYMGIFVMSFSVANAVAPTIGTWVYERSPDGLWYSCLACGLVTCLGFLALSFSFVRSPAEQDSR